MACWVACLPVLAHLPRPNHFGPHLTPLSPPQSSCTSTAAGPWQREHQLKAFWAYKVGPITGAPALSRMDPVPHAATPQERAPRHPAVQPRTCSRLSVRRMSPPPSSISASRPPAVTLMLRVVDGWAAGGARV